MSKLFKVVLTGGPTSCLMHFDNIDAQAQLEQWRAANKRKKQVKGDDRCPAWVWRTYLYSDGKHIVCPWANVQSCLLTGAAEFKAAGKRNKTLKSSVPVALTFKDDFEFIPAGRETPISVEEINAINSEDFEDHKKAAAALGIILDLHPVKVGMSRHVRVRPRFPAGWRATGIVENTRPDVIDDQTLLQIFQHCGESVGLFDWRPSAPKRPGPHGRFTAAIELLK